MGRRYDLRYPSGTLSSLWTLWLNKDIRFLQVRHEETGALAAVVEAKWWLYRVAVGSGGPGATPLDQWCLMQLWITLHSLLSHGSSS